MAHTRVIATQPKLALPWPADTSALATTEVTNILQQHGMLTALALGYPLKSWHEPTSQPPAPILQEFRRELAQHINFGFCSLHVVRAVGRIVEVSGMLRKPRDPTALIFVVKPPQWSQLIKSYYFLLNHWYDAILYGPIGGDFLNCLRKFRARLIELAPQVGITVSELGLWLDHMDNIIDWMLG